MLDREPASPPPAFASLPFVATYRSVASAGLTSATATRRRSNRDARAWCDSERCGDHRGPRDGKGARRSEFAARAGRQRSREGARADSLRRSTGAKERTMLQPRSRRHSSRMERASKGLLAPASTTASSSSRSRGASKRLSGADESPVTGSTDVRRIRRRSFESLPGTQQDATTVKSPNGNRSSRGRRRGLHPLVAKSGDLEEARLELTEAERACDLRGGPPTSAAPPPSGSAPTRPRASPAPPSSPSGRRRPCRRTSGWRSGAR